MSEPADLLSLARTSKGIRHTLMRKAAKPLWAASFRDAGIPHIMEDSLCEPAIASHLFDDSHTVRLSAMIRNHFLTNFLSE